MPKLRKDNAEISGERQSVGGAKEKDTITKTGQSLSFHHKSHPTGKMYIDPKCVFRQKSNINPVFHSRCSLTDGRSSVGLSTSNDEELVKHMSNVPSFLQRENKEDNNLQGKALNFGVLDWKKLESWKYNERMPKGYPKKKPVSNNSLSSPCGPPKMSPNLRKPSTSQNVLKPDIPNISYLGKQPLRNVPRYLSPTRQPASTPYTSHLNASVKGRNDLFPVDKRCVEGIKSKEKELCKRKCLPAHKSSLDNPHQHHKLHEKGFSPTYLDSCRRNDLEKNLLPKMVALSSEQAFNRKLSPSSRENSKLALPSEEIFTSECGPMEEMFTAPPRHSQEGSFSGSSQVTEPETYLDEQLAEAIRSKLHDFFSPQELYSEEFVSSTRHSCPLPSRATTNTKPAINQKFGMKMDKKSCPAANSVKPLRSEGKTSTVHEKTTHHHPSSVGCQKEHATIPARPSEKGRYSSPSRFSFNLGKMSRTFSFKDISVIPQLKSTYISVRSGPIKPEVSSNTETFGGKRDHEDPANSKGRSSPLRRLLDPLLKHKIPQPTKDTTQPSKGRPNFMTFMKSPSKRQSQDKKKLGVSVSHALVQLTLKNGAYFEFLVDDKHDMLAAAVKRLPTTKKAGDPCLAYTFYSVREVRKMGINWMSQGSRHKSGSLGYNIIGQMVMSPSTHSDAVECILYGASSGKATNEKTPESVANNELAAVVVRFSNRSITRENGVFNNTLLILPGGGRGGGHGMPVKGTPTSLISRWRSNGVCDCGGWDVGCKLRILTDSNNGGNTFPTLTPSPHVTLFQQGEKQKRDPLFSLEPLKNGCYSVTLDASISFLEAFATCVAYITCREFPELVDAKLVHKANAEFLRGDEKAKGGKITGNYFTCPPLSPAGRI